MPVGETAPPRGLEAPPLRGWSPPGWSVKAESRSFSVPTALHPVSSEMRCASCPFPCDTVGTAEVLLSAESSTLSPSHAAWGPKASSKDGKWQDRALFLRSSWLSHRDGTVIVHSLPDESSCLGGE